MAPQIARAKPLLLQLLLFVVLAGSVELYCRIHLRSEGYETGNGMAVLDPRSGYVHGAKPGEINEDGLRNPPVNGPSAAGEVRILVLGGSVVAGWDVAGPEVFCRRLQALLNEKAPPGLSYTVVNAGIPGYSTYDCMRLLTRIGPRYRPTITIAMCGVNERCALRYEPDREEPVADPVRGVLYRSATYRYLWRKLLPAPAPVGGINQAWADMCTANLDCMSRYVRAQGGHMLLAFEAQIQEDDMMTGTPQQRAKLHALWPAWTNGFLKPAERALLPPAWRKWSAENGVPMVDVLEELRRSRQPLRDLFVDHCHFNRAGHEEVARILARALWSLGWVETAPYQ